MMRNLVFGVLFMLLVTSAWAQMISETYTAGDIPSTYNTAPSPTTLADEPGILTVTIPAGATVNGVDVEYDFTAHAGAWMSEQRSYMRCTSPGGTAETELYSGAGLGGTFSYERTDLGIANNVTTNEITFELHAFRTWGGGGSDTDYNYINNNTWTVTVHYLLAGAPEVPTAPNPAHQAMGVALNTGLSWTNGLDTDDVQVLFGTVNPPTNEVYDGVAITSLTNTEIGGVLDPLTTYYWRVVANNDDYTTPGPVWRFTTDWDDGSFQVGYGTVNNTGTGYPAPYGNWYYGSRQQMLIPASELHDAGMVAPGFIEGMAFDVVTPQGEQLGVFTIKVRTTTLTALTDFVTDDLNTVWGPQSYTDVSGWNNHEFTTPFFWDGASNLLVETSFENDSFSNNAIFNQTATPGYVSTITYRQDTGYNYNNPTVDISSEQRVNVVFTFEMTDTGTLDGHVNDTVTGDPIEGATIHLVDSPYSTMTNDMGYFIFGTIQEGTYDVVATKHGYSDHLIEDVEIEADETTTISFNIEMLDNVSVSGRVVGSDAPDTGLTDATVTLVGYEDYSAVTNATGHFTIDGIYSGHTYTMTVTHENYQSHTEEVEVDDVDLDLGDIILEEIAFAPHSVVAEVTDDNDVHVTWESPAPGDNWFEDFEGGTMPAGWASTGANNDTGGPTPGFWTVLDYSSPDYDPFDEYHAGLWWSFDHQDEWLITPEFTCPAADLVYWTAGYEGSTNADHYYVKVSTDGGNTWTILQDLSALTGNAWNYYDYPYTIPLDDYTGQTIQLAWNAVDGPTNDGLWYVWFVDNISVGDVTFRGTDLMRVSKSSTNEDYRVSSLATASGQTAYRSMARDGNTQARVIDWPGFDFNNFTRNDIRRNSVSTERNNRALEGYVVYRLLAADQNNEALWDELETINDAGITDLTDTGWSALDQGVYRYAVKAMYTNNVLSNPAFSNTLEHSMNTMVTITLTTNSGDSPAGTNVSLANIDGDPNHHYEATAPGSGIVVFPSVWVGTYILTVHHPAFDLHEETNVQISGDTFTHGVELIESLHPIVDLQHEIHNGNNVVLEWLEPGSSTGTEQWMHWDSGDNHDSIGTGQAAQFSVATRFTPQNLEDLEVGGLYLTTIRFWPSVPTATYTLKVWQGGSSAPWNAGNEVVSQAVPNVTADTWNEVVLNNPVLIDPAQEIWFGYDVNTPEGYPAGCDAGPAVNGYGNMMYFGDEWNTLIGIAPTLDYNWNIQGYAGASRGEKAVGLTNTRNAVEQRDEMTSRALLGYKIVRNEMVLAEEHGELTYTDSNVPNGTYIYSVIAQYTTGESEAVMTEQVTILNVEDDLITTPLVTELKGNYPNPFNPDTNIAFSLKEAELVTLEIYNVKGQKIRTLVNDELMAGDHTVVWNGRNDNNREVGSGIFFYRMKTDSYSETRKMIMMK